jgi:hypothetical protein
MSHHSNSRSEDLRTIHCTVVEVPAMNDPFDPRPEDGLRDLVPWADPYIAALIDKLRRAVENDRRENYLIDDVPPPQDSRDSDRDDPPGQWTPRSWPDE